MRALRPLRLAVSALVASVALAGCGSDTPGTTTPTPTPAISITVTTPSPVTALAIPVGAQVSIALTRSGGFTGTVTVAAEGLPTGWTASFAPAQITTGAGSLATVTVPGNTARGAYPVTFRATATGVTAATGQATITVQ